jgi:ABC-type branched-subunit amino acid transport system substrate-binding protein
MKGRKRIALFSFLILLLVALPTLAACGDDDEDKTPMAEEKSITIGGTLCLTGPAAAVTGPGLQPLLETIRYINEVEGGIDGIKIRFVWADDKYDPATAAIAYKRLRDRDHPILWWSHSSADIVAGAKDIFERDRTPMIVTFAFDPELLRETEMIFCWLFNHANNLTGLVSWILQDWEASGKVGRPKLGYLHWDMPHGNAPLNIGIARWAEEHGVDFVSRTYQPMPLDLRPHLLALRDEGADYVFLSGTMPEWVVLVRDGRAAGLWDEMKFIIDQSGEAYTMFLPVVGEDAEGLYQIANSEPWSAGPEVAKAHRVEAQIREWAGHSPTRLDGAVPLKPILTAVVRQAVADVGYENLNGEAMYNAMLKTGPIDTEGGTSWVGWGPDRNIGASGIKMVQYRKLPPGSEVPPDGIMMETVAVSDWIETTNISEGEW